jgi:hypothetical protein
MRQQVWMLVILWIALQVPLGSFVGEYLRFGASGSQESVPRL